MRGAGLDRHDKLNNDYTATFNSLTNVDYLVLSYRYGSYTSLCSVIRQLIPICVKIVIPSYMLQLIAKLVYSPGVPKLSESEVLIKCKLIIMIYFHSDSFSRLTTVATSRGRVKSILITELPENSSSIYRSYKKQSWLGAAVEYFILIWTIGVSLYKKHIVLFSY